MLKINLGRFLLLFFFSLLILNSAAQAFFLPLPPRVTVWGLAGSDLLGRADAMAALFGNDTQILWIDTQGKYGNESTGFAGLGFGYRFVNQNARVLGLYNFIDYSHSSKGNSFWIASPGVESMGENWDFRINGYFPISSKTKSSGSAFGDDIGINQYVFFTGHQQYDRLFDLTETTGNGLDSEIGHTFPMFHHARAYIGGYYFHPTEARNIHSIQGISGRLEYPIRSHLNILATDNYDNFMHNTALIGLKVSFGGLSSEVYPTEAQDRILDPIYRNLATQSNGNSIPVVEGAIVESGRLLERDHIYFFNSAIGNNFNADLGAANCTAESPCNGASFNQKTVDAINSFEPETNFYFTPGTYTFAPAPNGRLSLNMGQSMFGRTWDYTLPAQGSERALFLGGMDLFQGNNRLDSIQLLDQFIDTTGTASQIIALNIENAPNIVLFNSNISAIAEELGNLPSGNENFATGISANNSDVLIKDSVINATALVIGDNNGDNFATGIGENANSGTANFVGNNFVIINSIVNGLAFVGDEAAAGRNAAAGIGNHSIGVNADFINNNFTLRNSQVNATASITGSGSGANLANGIGISIFVNPIDGNFINNNFILINSTVNTTANIGINNTGRNIAAGIGGNASNAVITDFISNNFSLFNSHINSDALIGKNNAGANATTGIGGNTFVGASDADFLNNHFFIIDSTVNALASVGMSNSGRNIGIGIGGNRAMGSTADFISNHFSLTRSDVSSSASAGINSGANITTGIGGNAFVGINDADFIDNDFFISSSHVNSSASVIQNNSGSRNIATGIGSAGANVANFIHNNIILYASNINSVASVAGINDSDNIATGIGGNTFVGISDFIQNNISIINSSINAIAKVKNNNNINIVTGIGGQTASTAFQNNNLLINSSRINASAIVNGNNTGTNEAIGIDMNSNGNVVNIDQSFIGVLAHVFGNNSNINEAIALNAEGTSKMNISNSVVNTTARIDGINSGTNQAFGIDPTATGTFVINNTIFQTNTINE